MDSITGFSLCAASGIVEQRATEQAKVIKIRQRAYKLSIALLMCLLL